MLFKTLVVGALQAALVAAQVTFQNSSQTILRTDNGTYGPEIEEVHYCKMSYLQEFCDSTLTQIQTMANGRLA